ncbi:hypothetical protein SCHPADRAFT_712388 [Schizopora paradoxa]|uniref:Uncharacterized protein n=1 Tax=Schizopora paradoxa TaxID=27342 RepID=A0A0H2R1Z1_9AGAM|nr:hypothetical protein SCHPADRAFT_712388 [Schizopora paradoxa]
MPFSPSFPDLRPCPARREAIRMLLNVGMDMDNSKPSQTCLKARVQIAHDDSPGDGDASDNISPLLSSFLDELREGDATTIYSYFSTWSTNYTMSNLPGPGRLLGNLYSKAGVSLEKRLASLVSRAARREYEDAVEMLHSDGAPTMLNSNDRQEQEKACEMLLICAQ